MLEQKIKILVVEDELVIALHLESVLEELGHHVIGSCGTGVGALSIIEDETPDLIFMDIKLSKGSSGIDAVKKIKKIIDVPVIYLTSNTDNATINATKETLPAAFLKKPFDENQLQATIQTVITKFKEDKKTLKAVTEKIELKDISLNELEETNAHLINATWRERELKQQLQESLDELHKSKEIIDQQNIKIKESINYSKRIQSATIPSIKDFESIFPDSFIIYKPKDVVSGDYPWFYKEGNIVYVAAVDCTGHGVPGAMMAMLSVLLLNQIVEKNINSTPGDILNSMHKSIVKTLKQDDPLNTASDGLDIALCRINLDTHEIQYAGAHRPLYYTKKNELQELKGSKFPIGGKQYKGLNSFETNTIFLDKRSTIYLFSDGFPDQFGGEKNRKFGSKRIKDTISKFKSLNMQEVRSVLENSLVDWMEEAKEKQYDDILMMGIRF